MASKAGIAAGKYAAQNRRARHDYFIQETIEAGIVLSGTEVKSLRAGKASIGESFASDKDGEIFLMNAYISEYSHSKFDNHPPRRPRKLLLHRKEMAKLLGNIRREGITLVPLGIYWNERGYAKVELGIAKGKKKADKREANKERDWKRDKARLLREKG